MNQRQRRAGLPTTGARPRPQNLLEGIEAELRKPRAKPFDLTTLKPGSLEEALRTFHLSACRARRLHGLDPWRADAAKAMKEDRGKDSVESHFRAVLKRLRLPLAYHTHRSDMSEAGFPDWTVPGDPGCGLMFAGLKAESGKFSAAQMDWMLALEASGAFVTYFSAVDVFNGRMEHELSTLKKGSR